MTNESPTCSTTVRGSIGGAGGAPGAGGMTLLGASTEATAVTPGVSAASVAVFRASV